MMTCDSLSHNWILDIPWQIARFDNGFGNLKFKESIRLFERKSRLYFLSRVRFSSYESDLYVVMSKFKYGDDR